MQGNNLVLEVIQENKPQTIQHVEEVKDTLPPHFSHLIDIEDYFDPKFDKTTITPFFWHVAKAAGTSVQYYYSQCFRLIIASEIGASKSSNQLEIMKENGVKCHVNVDTSTSEGIMHAKELKLAHSHTAQMIISPLFYEAANDLFTSEDKGVMFAMFRHPIQRVISLFYYLQTATHEVTYNPKLAEMTIEEYAESPLLEANFIIRSLVNKMEEPLSMSDLNLAKEILRRKCVIGLMQDFGTSLQLYNNAFGFHPNLSVEVDGEENTDRNTKQTNVDTCGTNLQSKGGTNKHKHAKLAEDSKAYEIIKKKNYWDMLLWDFIEDLYREQQLKAMEKDLGFEGINIFKNKA